MTTYSYDLPDPKLDLVLERVVDVPVELVWRAWTDPEILPQWWCPKPWTTPKVEMHVRPGGMFHTTMRSPEGQDFPNAGCYLEVIENRKLIFTSALGAGYRPVNPVNNPDLAFTAIITMEPAGKGCKYSARAMHQDENGAKKHAEMGFHDGWGTVLEQLVALMKTKIQ